jgi:hypothetical protein
MTEDEDRDNRRARQARRGSPLLKSKEAAEYLRINDQSLARMRMDGRGPKFERRGRFLRYHIADLEAWLKDNPDDKT